MTGYYAENNNPFPATAFSFSILVSSPIRCNVPFSPVSAMIFPLARIDLPLAGMIIAGLDILMTFLFKFSLFHPPNPQRTPPDMYPLTLNMTQLAELLQYASRGQLPMPLNGSPLGQGSGPVGNDEPLFPDNLSVSLIVGAPFAPFDGSPDSSFNVPMFELPGIPGNLVLAFGMILAQFILERSGLSSPGCEPGGTNNGNQSSSNGGQQ